jgi:hypothetical protein
MSMSPFSIKCETHPYYACFLSKAKGDTCYRYASPIWCPCPKISGPTRSLLNLSSATVYVPWTPSSPPVVLKNSTVLDPGPSAQCHPRPQPRARHHRLQVRHRYPRLDPRAHRSPQLQSRACCCRPQARRHHRPHRRHHRPTICLPGAPPPDL